MAVPPALVRRLCLAVLLVLPAQVLARAGDGDAKDKPHAGAEQHADERYPLEFRQRVNATIDRGVAWVLEQQQPDGSWPCAFNKAYPMGPSALATLTLLKGGVKPGHPAVRKAFAHLRTLPMKKTYSVAVLLMAIDAAYAPARDPFVVEKVDRYGRSERRDPCLEHIAKEDLAWMKRGVTFLVEHQTGKGVWRYPTKQTFDLSNTQYALLGLKAALRCGIKIPTRVWLDALTFLLDHQEKDGEPVEYRGNEVRGRYRLQWKEKAKTRGFRYVAKAKAVTGSMTTAGLSSLIICQSELWDSRKFRGDLRQRTRLGIRDAMAWLQVWLEVRVNPIQRLDGKPGHLPAPAIGGPNHDYYLYGLERAAILGRIRYFGERDWYEEGAEILMADQEADGSWPATQGLVDSCFAILFLKRATVRMKVPVITAGGSAPPKDTRAKGR